MVDTRENRFTFTPFECSATFDVSLNVPTETTLLPLQSIPVSFIFLVTSCHLDRCSTPLV
uniref:Uncharacterized protein n=1 Tax=Anguilla anguilla TaxID=7936 RepID=A0A0E9RT77_ANGAN